MANLFGGVSNTFVHLCIKEVSEAFLFFYAYQRAMILRMSRLYKQRWGFPICAGAIDGTHIAIQAPAKNHADYVNKKKYHSIVMQAVVHCRYLYHDIVTGWPGSMHDPQVLSNSELYNHSLKSQLFDINVNERSLGVDLGPIILGDPAYPLLE